jgi:hypothetical protein
MLHTCIHDICIYTHTHKYSALRAAIHIAPLTTTNQYTRHTKGNTRTTTKIKKKSKSQPITSLPFIIVIIISIASLTPPRIDSPGTQMGKNTDYNKKQPITSLLFILIIIICIVSLTTTDPPQMRGDIFSHYFTVTYLRQDQGANPHRTRLAVHVFMMALGACMRLLFMMRAGVECTVVGR